MLSPGFPNGLFGRTAAGGESRARSVASERGPGLLPEGRLRRRKSLLLLAGACARCRKPWRVPPFSGFGRSAARSARQRWEEALGVGSFPARDGEAPAPGSSRPDVGVVGAFSSSWALGRAAARCFLWDSRLARLAASRVARRFDPRAPSLKDARIKTKSPVAGRPPPFFVLLPDSRHLAPRCESFF